MNIAEENSGTNDSYFRWAILKNYKYFYNKVVLDVGCGTGILSMFCVQAGAKKVYAVDGSDIAAEATKIIKSNNMEDKITVIHGKIEEIQLPEKVDVIVSEWMGYMLLYECMLPSVLYARDRWLKQSGVMFPFQAKLFLSLGCDDQHQYDSSELWDDLGKEYKVNLSALKPYAHHCASGKVHIKEVSGQDVISHGQNILLLNLASIESDLCQFVKAEFSLSCFGHTKVQCFVMWFDVDFIYDVKLTTSPYAETTHWQQCVLYLSDPIDVIQDTVISGTICISPSKTNKRFLEVIIQYRKDKGDEKCQTYIMDGFIT